MNNSPHTAQESPVPDERRISLGGSRASEFAMLAAVAGIAVILLVIAFGGAAEGDWAQALSCGFGFVAALIFSTLLAVDLYRPQMLTRARLKGAAYALVALGIGGVVVVIVRLFM